MSLIATSYIATGAAVVTRSRDQFTVPFLARPQAMTIYLRFVESGTAIVQGGKRLLQIGATANTAPRLIVQFASATTGYRLLFDNGQGLQPNSDAPSAPTMGDVVELRCLLSATGTVQIGQSINGAAEATGSVSSAARLPVAWSDSLLSVNSVGTAAEGWIALRNLLIVAENQSLPTMRRLAGVA